MSDFEPKLKKLPSIENIRPESVAFTFIDRDGGLLIQQQTVQWFRQLSDFACGKEVTVVAGNIISRGEFEELAGNDRHFLGIEMLLRGLWSPRGTNTISLLGSHPELYPQLERWNQISYLDSVVINGYLTGQADFPDPREIDFHSRVMDIVQGPDFRVEGDSDEEAFIRRLSQVMNVDYYQIGRALFRSGAGDVATPTAINYVHLINTRTMAILEFLHYVRLGMTLEMIRKTNELAGFTWEALDSAALGDARYMTVALQRHPQEEVLLPGQIFARAEVEWKRILESGDYAIIVGVLGLQNLYEETTS